MGKGGPIARLWKQRRSDWIAKSPVITVYYNTPRVQLGESSASFLSICVLRPEVHSFAQAVLDFSGVGNKLLIP